MSFYTPRDTKTVQNRKTLSAARKIGPLIIRSYVHTLFTPHGVDMAPRIQYYALYYSGLSSTEEYVYA